MTVCILTLSAPPVENSLLPVVKKKDPYIVLYYIAAAIVGMLLLAYIGFRIYKSRETIYNFQCTADV